MLGVQPLENWKPKKLKFHFRDSVTWSRCGVLHQRQKRAIRPRNLLNFWGEKWFSPWKTTWKKWFLNRIFMTFLNGRHLVQCPRPQTLLVYELTWNSLFLCFLSQLKLMGTKPATLEKSAGRKILDQNRKTISAARPMVRNLKFRTLRGHWSNVNGHREFGASLTCDPKIMEK